MNNFDTSTSGVNLDLACFYDCDLSRMYFEDYFIKDNHALTQYRSEDVYHYLDHGNIEAIDLASIDAYKATKKDLVDMIKGASFYGMFGATCDMLTFYKETADIALSKASKQDLFEWLESEFDKEFLCELYRQHLQPRYEIVSIRGHCQGDYAEIIVPDQYWQVVGVEKPSDVQAYLESTFINLFYDAPIYCRLDIDGEELHFYEYMQDQYRYDTDELIAIANDVITHEKKAYILEWLADNLPQHPDYC